MKQEVTKEQRIAQLRAAKALRESGFGGVDRNGNLVDRRKQPSATPIRQNSKFGIPRPRIIK